MEETKINLPKGFLLGAASAAHQVEGNNTNSDWWFYEAQGKLPRSGWATDHYNRYEQDFRLAEQIGLNLMRISIEWARIEPEEGRFSMAEIEHYRKVLITMKSCGLKRMVTLWHYTLPKWLADQGGVLNKNTPEKFARYSKFVAQQLGQEIDYFITINEPEVYAYMGYGKGLYPPFKKNWWQVYLAENKMISMHNKAYESIKQVLPESKIGLAKQNVYFDSFRPKNWWDNFGVFVSEFVTNYYPLNRMNKHLDFIGLNYYFHHTMKGFAQANAREGSLSDMGWRIFPEGIYNLLVDLKKKYHKPIFITENGIANTKDDLRKDFIKQHLIWIKKAIDEGVDIKGYCYWTLVDNYEWLEGYTQKFGLIEFDPTTQERKIRPSAKIFKEINN